MDRIEWLTGIETINIKVFALLHALIHEFKALFLRLAFREFIDRGVIHILDLVDSNHSHDCLIKAQAEFLILSKLFILDCLVPQKLEAIGFPYFLLLLYTLNDFHNAVQKVNGATEIEWIIPIELGLITIVQEILKACICWA
jgi:hypothetical protein